MEQAILLRNKMKTKKPEFESQDVNVYKQNKGKWRRPKGIHSKMRRGFRGQPVMPSIGYGSPKSARGAAHDGSKVILISHIKQLEDLNGNPIMLSSRLGLKKRTEILTKTKEKNIKVVNIRDVNLYLDKAKKMLELRKAEGAKKTEKKTKTKEEAEKKAQAQEKKDEPKK